MQPRNGGRWRPWLIRGGTCCGATLLALSAIPLFVLYGIARSGVVTIPVMSARVHHDRPPLRVVPPALVSVEQLFRNARVEAPDVLAIRATERELTGLLRSICVAHADVPAAACASAQVAIASQFVELYAHVPNASGDPVTIRLRLRPQVAEQRITATVEEVVVGNFRVPRVFARALVSGMLERVPELRWQQDGIRVMVDAWEWGEGEVVVRVRRAPPP
ncbi:hypothetical protein HY632_00120 [Candidatus Uhrbacteria bacterium]|nr:hypothetical protein [Candidatus Uhrbacteria bacterium]